MAEKLSSGREAGGFKRLEAARHRPRRPHQMGKAKAHRCFSTPKISSSITSRGTNHSEGSRGNSRVAPTTDSLAGGAPIAPASPSPEQGERSPSQEWRQQLASSLLTPSCWGLRAPVRETRRSSSASDLTRCSRSRKACPETDWVGKSRRGPGPPFDSTG